MISTHKTRNKVVENILKSFQIYIKTKKLGFSYLHWYIIVYFIKVYNTVVLQMFHSYIIYKMTRTYLTKTNIYVY